MKILTSSTEKTKKVNSKLKPRVAFDTSGAINLNRPAFDLLPIKPTKDAEILVDLSFSEDGKTLFVVPLISCLNGSPLTLQTNKVTGEIIGGYLGPARKGRHAAICVEAKIELPGRFYSTGITTCETDEENPRPALGILLSNVIASSEKARSVKDAAIASAFTSELKAELKAEFQAELDADEPETEPESYNSASPLPSAKVIKTALPHVNSRGLDGYGRPIA